MPYTLWGDEATQETDAEERRISGVAIATVESNRDIRGEGRVQVSYPWAPGITAWARVAVPYAGMNRGFYFMPQDGDEVLVAFQNGNISAPYVIGSLWNTLDRPPITPGDILAPSTKRVIRTGTAAAHEIVFDDLDASITITSSTRQQVTMAPDRIELSTTGGLASVKLDTAGNISIEGALSIDLKAQRITINGTNVSVSGTASTDISGGAQCSVQAALVRIN
jgi:uncharacterized protein involved in type VI secretion and phage assembly